MIQVVDLLAVDDHRGRQEAALGADLDPVRAGQADRRCPGVGKTFGSVCAAATSAAFSATSVAPMALVQSVPAVGSATYHWKLKKRSFAAFRMRKRYDFGSRVIVG